jgi:hypothetical protein
LSYQIGKNLAKTRRAGEKRLGQAGGDSALIPDQIDGSR